jgi:hypothetical protein
MEIFALNYIKPIITNMNDFVKRKSNVFDFSQLIFAPKLETFIIYSESKFEETVVIKNIAD